MRVEFKGVDFSYPHKDGMDVSVLESFTDTFKTKKVSAIVGPSGCGKSTILKLIAGLLNPSYGKIFIGRQSPELRRQQGTFGLIFQSPDLLPWRTVEGNVQLPLELLRKSTDSIAVWELLKDVGLDSWSDKRPHQLSGGMQQRIALARALVAKPKILLLDEPFSHLDELLRFELLFLLDNYIRENQTTVIMVSHDVSEAVTIADQVYVLPDRPLKKAEIFDIPFPRPRTIISPSSKKFRDLVDEIRYSLKK